MKSPRTILALVAATATAFLAITLRESAAQEAPSPEEIAALMEKAKKYLEPNEHHAALERFVGQWTTETRFYMGPTASPPEKGVATCEWILGRRFVRTEAKGTLMGKPVEHLTIVGYDTFKQSYVASMLSSMETALRHAEGDMTRDGSALIVYGTLDEYLTGEHDKMVKYVWRFRGKDRIVLEIHDLPIGEENTKVVEVVFTRPA